jgi:basic amino acid/polyamine antiporter, APA family
MIAFVAVLFYALTIFGIFILRRKRPDMERPYKAFGYPMLPVVYILLALVFCVALIIQKPDYAGWGLAIVLVGIPLYYLAPKGGKMEEGVPGSMEDMAGKN